MPKWMPTGLEPQHAASTMILLDQALDGPPVLETAPRGSVLFRRLLITHYLGRASFVGSLSFPRSMSTPSIPATGNSPIKPPPWPFEQVKAMNRLHTSGCAGNDFRLPRSGGRSPSTESASVFNLLVHVYSICSTRTRQGKRIWLSFRKFIHFPRGSGESTSGYDGRARAPPFLSDLLFPSP